MKIYIAGDRGMVGSALVRRLTGEPGVTVVTRSREKLDLEQQAQVEAFFAAERPEVAIIAAARVGGIYANKTYPAEFIYSNMIVAANAIHAAWKQGTKRLLFLGSSCIYPKHAPQPMPEECLLTSPLEPTNEAYAIAKIAGLKLCQYYRQQHGVLFHSAMPTNLYGPGDNYHLENSHVLPALLRKFHEAKEAGRAEVVAWGTGAPKREFLHVDDLADACAFLLTLENPPDWINVGTGTDVTIKELTETVAEVTGFGGRIVWDASKPDGTPRKLLDVSRLTELGWRARIALREGVARTYAAFLAEQAAGTLRGF
ncbi:GDP-L-fucose synthase [Horticoccus luteus]|uniref:GDP-L-fucose synthase n=1 Tax=Horticoccus luteus TaxID=2862869 RepID=A0A8F9TRX2_9BACT|nr:GDP-L-fucose synthase [Horticoccus luteus]QYM77895.1 GDP-L-fucose synthase [Horticoccus luteus]